MIGSKIRRRHLSAQYDKISFFSSVIIMYQWYFSWHNVWAIAHNASRYFKPYYNKLPLFQAQYPSLPGTFTNSSRRLHFDIWDYDVFMIILVKVRFHTSLSDASCLIILNFTSHIILNDTSWFTQAKLLSMPCRRRFSSLWAIIYLISAINAYDARRYMPFAKAAPSSHGYWLVSYTSSSVNVG